MRVLILGGTGSIGGAVLSTLIKQKHHVLALSRSTDSERKIRVSGATPIAGDIRYPEQWIDSLENVDAVIHAAATWGDDMDAVDQALVTTLLTALRTSDSTKTLIYTGGCWLYGKTGDSVATEQTLMSSAPGYSTAIDSMNKVLADTHVRGMVIHPAMVYEHRGGVFAGMYQDIKTFGHVRVFGSLSVRWPLIHSQDLAQVYALMLQGAKGGDVFNASVMDGVAIGDIARAISSRAGIVSEPVVYPVEQAKAEFGDWAEGYALDQQMSGQKAITQLAWLPEHHDVFNDIGVFDAP